MISVITPCKDIIKDGREPFFRKMMETLYRQTYKNFEHIVVDGASTDGTLDLLQEYKNKNKIDLLISEKDKNVNHAMNKGLRLAKGDYIHVMNSDNYFTNNKFFEISLQVIKDRQVDFTHADRSIVTRQGKFVSIKKGDKRSAFFRMPFRYQTMIFKKDVYNQIGPFDERYDIAADYKFMLNMLMANKRGYHISKVFICSLDKGITSDRNKVTEEVSQVLYECYGKKYGLNIEECKDICTRKISRSLFSKIITNVKDKRIIRSLNYCYKNFNEYSK